MNRCKKFLVLDVETANSLDEPLVYDIGFAICDKYGTIYRQESWVVKEIFKQGDLMRSAYYASKIPKYLENISTKQSKVGSFENIRWHILDLMKQYKITTVCAYNCSFDRRALNTTLRYLTQSKYRWFFPYDTEFNCIWNMACQMLYTQKRFLQFAVDNEYFSKSGNIHTSAEVGTRYLNQDLAFEEEHQGLQDVLIEIAIMVQCYRKHKKMDKNINRLCWKIPTEKYKKYLEKGLTF